MLRVKDILLCCSQKRGLPPADFEDAFTPISEIILKNSIKFSIADGATESSFSKEWAQLLVRKFNGSAFDVFDNAMLTELVKEWEKKIDRANLSWNSEEKLQHGSYAALLGVEVDLSKQEFKAVAVGDCCLMLVRGGVIIKSFPIENADDFSNHPALVGTKGGFPVEAKKELAGLLQGGDIMIFASDALAAWILTHKDIKPWEFFIEIMSDELRVKQKDVFLKNVEEVNKQYEKVFSVNQNYFSRLVFGEHKETNQTSRWGIHNLIFRSFIVKERASGRLKNDDVTLFVIEFENNP